jgi:cbb3-type cytochrome oxidase subunit 1
MSVRFFKIAVIAFVASVGVGLFMGIAHDRSYVSLHAHLALTGWVSMALFAVAYRLWPQLGSAWLAKSHFWLYTVGFFVMMAALVLLESGNVDVGDPLAGLGSTVAGLGVLCFAAQVLRSDLTAAAG